MEVSDNTQVSAALFPGEQLPYSFQKRSVGRISWCERRDMEKALCPDRNSNCGVDARSQISTQTELVRLQ
jgi:hypothetical protein